MPPQVRLFLPCIAAIGLGGCATVGVDPNVTTLQRQLAADHTATIAVLEQMNREDRPFRIGDAVGRATFADTDLDAINPNDIKAWDKTLTALDDYCTALAALASGQQGSDFAAASETLGSNVTALVRGASFTSPAATSAVGTAVKAIGQVLINVKADADLQTVAREADPQFQRVIGLLISSLGFAGDPPAVSGHGMLAVYEAHFESHYAQVIKKFHRGTIAGYATMTAPEREESINELLSWQDAESDHDAFVASVSTLAGALNDVARTHHAVAYGTPESIAALVATLQTEATAVQAICEQFSKG